VRVLQVDHHTVKLHTAFIKDRKDDDFSKWHEAWLLADHDHDGKIPVQEAARVFKVRVQQPLSPLGPCACTRNKRVVSLSDERQEGSKGLRLACN
jgi:hypothetical protein